MCVGGGYVGGPSMSIIALKCPNATVHVFDASAARVEAWNASPTRHMPEVLPIYEPGLQEIVLKVRGRNLFFTTDPSVLKDADIIFIAVSTPTKLHGVGSGCAADLTYVEQCAKLIAQMAEKKKVIVVEKSTVPVKCHQMVKRVLKCYQRPSVRFDILSNPEFLAEGTAIQDLLYPDRVLIGGDSHDAISQLSSVYEHWVPKERIIPSNLWSSELSKLVSNALLAQRISSINSITPLCERTGASIDEIKNAVSRDRRIGKYFLNASVGFGGSCFQKDVLNLIYIFRSEGLMKSAEYWEQVILMNNYQKARFYEKTVQMCCGTLRGKKVGILGFAFKKNTSDTRESAAIYICAKLLTEGARLSIYDPKVPAEAIYTDLEHFINSQHFVLPSASTFSCIDQLRNFITSHVQICSCPFEVARNASALLVLTEWDELRMIDFNKVYNNMRKPANILDGRLILDHQKLRSIGFDVFAVGKNVMESHL